MKLVNAACLVCILFCVLINVSDAAPVHTIKGIVITPDGTVVPEFSLVVRHVTDKPELVNRQRFRNGEFTVDGLTPGKYQIHIAAPSFIGAQLVFDLTAPPRDTDYSIVVLHKYRNEARLLPGENYAVSVKVLQQKIPPAARDAYLKGVTLHRDGKLEEALIEYGNALRRYPRYVDALTDIGTIFLMYNRPEPALTFLRRAQDVDDCNPIVNLNIAVGLTEQEDYGAALKLLKTILHREPRTALAQYFAAKIYYTEKKYDQAEAYIRQAITNDPGLLDALVLMVNIKVELKKYDEAREGLQRIRERIDNQRMTNFVNEQLSVLGS